MGLIGRGVLPGCGVVRCFGKPRSGVSRRCRGRRRFSPVEQGTVLAETWR